VYKKIVVTIIITLGMITGYAINPTFAQDGECSPDIEAYQALLTQLQEAEGSDAINEALQALRFEAIMDQLECLGLITDSGGETRANPVPVGADQLIFFDSFSSNFEGTASVIAFTGLSDEEILDMNQFNDVAPEGQQYVRVDLELACGDAVVNVCEISPFSWNLVGSLGRVYESELVAGMEQNDSFELFGGGTVIMSVAFLVDATETDFVIYTDADEPVFFTVPQ